MSTGDLRAVAGLVALAPGDVVQNSKGQYIVTHVNDCRAHCAALTSQERTVTTRFGGSATFTAPGADTDMARNVPPEVIVERRGLGGLQQFLSAKTSRRRAGSNEQPGGDNTVNDSNTEDSMAKRNKTKGSKKAGNKPNKRQARGGLAAEQREAQASTTAGTGTTATTEPKVRNTKSGELCGHTVASVIRALGKAGWNTPRAEQLLAAKGLEVKKSTVATWLSDGRGGKYGKAAPLTRDQLAELEEAAPEHKLEVAQAN